MLQNNIIPNVSEAFQWDMQEDLEDLGFVFPYLNYIQVAYEDEE